MDLMQLQPADQDSLLEQVQPQSIGADQTSSIEQELYNYNVRIVSFSMETVD